MSCIAAVIACFDVVAVQEVRRDTSALRLLLTRLGPNWRFLTSDVTEGTAGNGERLTFLHRTDPGPAIGAHRRRGGVHVDHAAHHLGDNPSDRLPEITEIADSMRSCADRPGDWNDTLLLLGDFNLDRLDDPLYQAFVSTGLFPPAELNSVPRTIFDNDNSRHFYDQIAWFSTPDGNSLLQSMTYTHHGGSFDFTLYAFADLTRARLSWRISGHYPLATTILRSPTPASPTAGSSRSGAVAVRYELWAAVRPATADRRPTTDDRQVRHLAAVARPSRRPAMLVTCSRPVVMSE